MPLILDKVYYNYMPDTPYERAALKDVSVQIDKGEFIALIGHSGSGKSTLAQHLCGLLRPSAGRAFLDGADMAAKGEAARIARRKVGLVFQYPEHQLFAETVFDDVAFAPRNSGLAENEVKERVERALSFVRMAEFSERSPFQLSGGQMRKVAIAGIIAMQPDYLLLDEPTAGFDALARDAFYTELKALYQESGMAVLMITHNMQEAIELADRLLVMSDGKITLDGRPADIFQGQRSALAAAGVDVPPVVALADRLREGGCPLSYNCLTAESLSTEILQKRATDDA